MFTKSPAVPDAPPQRPFAVQAGSQAQHSAAAAQAVAGGGGANQPSVRGAQFHVRLSQPLPTHKGDISEIILRAPTLADYTEIGDIDTVEASHLNEKGNPTVYVSRPSMDVFMTWAVRLSGLDRIVLGALPPHDAGELIKMVRLIVTPFSRPTSGVASPN